MVNREKGAVTVLATDPARPPQNSCFAASIVRLSTSLDDSSIDVVAALVVDGVDDMMTTAAAAAVAGEVLF
jgi:hypothetical protein